MNENPKDPYWLSERVEPVNMAPIDLRPRVLCECCQQVNAVRQSAFAKEEVRISKSETRMVPTTERAPRMTLKVEGEACPRCGDNSPRGTSPKPIDSGWTRFGESAENYQYLYQKDGKSWAGNSAEYNALRAKQQKQTKRNRNAA